MILEVGEMHVSVYACVRVCVYATVSVHECVHGGYVCTDVRVCVCAYAWERCGSVCT